MSDISKSEIFYASTNDASDIPDTFFSNLNDALADATKNHKRYIIRCTQFYEIMIELEDISHEGQDA